MTNGESLTFLGMMAVGALQMALNPRRAARGWNSDHCSCTRVPDAMNPTCAVHGDKP